MKLIATPGATSKIRRSAFGMSIFGASCVLVGTGITKLPSESAQLGLWMLGFVLFGSLLLNIILHGWDPFEPLTIFIIAYGTVFLVRSVSVLRKGEFVYTRPTLSINYSDAFSNVVWLSVLGALGFFVGYMLPQARAWGQRLPQPPSQFHRSTLTTSAFVLLALGLILYGLFIYSSGGLSVLTSFLGGRDYTSQWGYYKGSTGYLYSAPYLLMPAAFILILLANVTNKRIYLFVAIIPSALLLIRALLIGSRMSLLPFIGGLLLYAYLRNDSRPRPHTLILLGLVALITSAFIVTTRDADSRGNGTSDVLISLVTNPGRALEPLTEGADNEMMEFLAAVLATGAADEVSFPISATLGDLALRPIPRLLWQEKPLPPREQIIAILWPDEYRFGVANPEASVLLYFYIDLEWLGVLLGMAVLGFLWRSIYEYFLQGRHSSTMQLIYASCLPFLVIGLRDSPTDTLLRASFMVLPFIAAVFISRKKSTHRLHYVRTKAARSA